MVVDIPTQPTLEIKPPDLVGRTEQIIKTTNDYLISRAARDGIKILQTLIEQSTNWRVTISPTKDINQYSVKDDNLLDDKRHIYIFTKDKTDEQVLFELMQLSTRAELYWMAIDSSPVPIKQIKFISENLPNLIEAQIRVAYILSHSQYKVQLAVGLQREASDLADSIQRNVVIARFYENG